MLFLVYDDDPKLREVKKPWKVTQDKGPSGRLNPFRLWMRKRRFIEVQVRSEPPGESVLGPK